MRIEFWERCRWRRWRRGWRRRRRRGRRERRRRRREPSNIIMQMECALAGSLKEKRLARRRSHTLALLLLASSLLLAVEWADTALRRRSMGKCNWSWARGEQHKQEEGSDKEEDEDKDDDKDDDGDESVPSGSSAIHPACLDGGQYRVKAFPKWLKKDHLVGLRSRIERRLAEICVRGEVGACVDENYWMLANRQSGGKEVGELSNMSRHSRLTSSQEGNGIWIVPVTVGVNFMNNTTFQSLEELRVIIGEGCIGGFQRKRM